LGVDDDADDDAGGGGAELLINYRQNQITTTSLRYTTLFSNCIGISTKTQSLDVLSKAFKQSITKKQQKKK
jgi:hypothetical protein